MTQPVRRYPIAEGAEEIQMRTVAAFLFGYMGQCEDRIGERTPASPAVMTDRPGD